MPVGTVRAAYRGPGRARQRWSARRRARFLRTLTVAAAITSASVVALAGILGAAAPVSRPARPLAAQTHAPAAAATVLGGAPETVAAGAAQQLFASAPVVVIANPGDRGLRAAARQAVRVHAPLLLATAPSPGRAAVAGAATLAAAQALHARSVLAVGVGRAALAARLRGSVWSATWRGCPRPGRRCRCPGCAAPAPPAPGGGGTGRGHHRAGGGSAGGAGPCR